METLHAAALTVVALLLGAALLLRRRAPAGASGKKKKPAKKEKAAAAAAAAPEGGARADAALCGFVAGFVAAVLTHPLDVVKTQRQTTAGDASGGGGVLGVVAGVVASARDTVAEAGTPAALFAGWKARAASASTSSAVLFFIYQTVLEALQ